MKTETHTSSYIARQKIVVVCEAAIVALSFFHQQAVDNQISGTVPGDNKSGELRKPAQGNSEIIRSLKAFRADLETYCTHKETRVMCSGFCFKAPF